MCLFFLSFEFLTIFRKRIFVSLPNFRKFRDTSNFHIYIYIAYIDFPRNRGNAWIFACRFASMATLDTCPETRRWAARLPCETHIKAVDKRKGALIVRRSSIHEVAGYGYTYVLRCAYTDPVCTRFPHTHIHARCDYSRVHVWCTCVITNTVESESCHAWSRHTYTHTCTRMEWFRGRENSPDLPQVPARMSR